MNFFKNRFLFIILISVATLALIVIGAISLYQDHSLVFDGDGYIIEATAKANNKYYFSANTKYKENVEEKISFSDKDAKKRSVDPASFIHYNNGNVAFLQRGAIVNLSELSNPMVTYYNITPENKVVYENNQYTVSSNGKKINLDSFLGRISDNKYIIAGNNVSLKIPKVEDRISGDFFEITYVEEGIVRIDNKDIHHQVTAQESYVYVGDNITINLGDGKIYFSGEPKMLLSQITINGDENIDLDVLKDKSSGGGTGSGDGSGGDGDGTGEGGDGTGEGEGGDGTGEGEGGDGTGEGGDGNGLSNGNGLADGAGSGNTTTASPKIELIEAIVSATTIDLSLQLNNANLANGPISYYFTNVATGERVNEPVNIDLVNGTFKIKMDSLSPSTEYSLSIGELNATTGRQYFQKTFKTDDLGITLEKVYATDTSLSYRIIFDENTDVSMVHLSIFDSDNKNDYIVPVEATISKNDLDKSFVFENLHSNTSYSIVLDRVWINNIAYSNVYSINRIDTTLKKTPVLSGIDVSANTEEIKFTIQLDKVNDPDNAIVNYVYNIYKADDITIDNLEPEVVYSVVKTDNDPLVLNLNEIAELKTGVDYRAKIVAQYDDNEMIREVSTDYSNNFLIKSKPNISFETNEVSMNKISGVLSLIDANCSIPIQGRSCLNESNTFTLRYYKMKDSETNENDTVIRFTGNKLTSDINLTDLASNTTYAMKLFGNYYDDNNVIHTNVQIGDTLYFTTDKSANLHLEVVGDNISGKNKDGSPNASNVVTFDAKLSAPQNSNIVNEIATITLNLYSGRYNTKEKLIGTYTMNERKDIEDFFDNITITNNLFTDATNLKLGKLNSILNLIKVTNNSTNSLNSDYTVEVEDVYDEGHVNKFKVEDNIYTFHLTSSYYLDTRISTNPNGTYITATPILKKNLSESEYTELSRTIKNLDLLNDDTVVGLVVENSLTDMFVDSAFTYEKVIVDYTIYNNATKKMAKTISEDMGNKYQPKTQTIYLDPSELDNGEHFTRGYNYKIGYVLNFTTEDGSNPTYTNDKLYKNLDIERQNPIYTQYISNSTDTTITYRYMMKDIDGAVADHNFYYVVGEGKEYLSVPNALIVDEEEHDVTFPINDRVHYSICYARKNTANQITYVSISEYDFEKEYLYDNSVSFEIIENNDNMLKIRLENNDITKRAIAYRINIRAKDRAVSDYSIYFLASKLSVMDVDTGTVDEEGNPISEQFKYIAIDYANISRFMKHEMVIDVLAYYDSGLVGIHQPFDKGLVIKNADRYLNVYNGSVNSTTTAGTDKDAMGLYLLKSAYNDTDKIFSVYNHLMNTNFYSALKGANYYDLETIPETIGMNFEVSATNAGLVFTVGKFSYSGYNVKVLKEAKLRTNKDTSLFNTIVPTVGVTTNSTINSIRVNMTARGIYGDSQFVKDNRAHRTVYLTFYRDQEKTELLSTITSNVTISGNDDDGYSATIDSATLANLDPDTTYYFTISAYIGNEYTLLYDSNMTTTYVTRIYSGKTLGTKELISSIRFFVEPTGYHGEFSEKSLTWRLGLKNTENYRLRFELYGKDGVVKEIDPETSSEIEVPKYKAVSFDGSAANACDKLSNGTSNNGYVSNCYINVDKSDVMSINNIEQKFKFYGNDFVFGDDFYKLVIYAVPYTNDAYVEDKKVVLYQNDSLSTTGVVTADGLTYNIKVHALDEATFTLNNTLDAGYDSNFGSYYLDFVPTIVDNYYVMNYGKYTITLQDDKRSVVSSCTAFVKDSTHNESTPIPLSPCRIQLDKETNAKVKFAGLTANTLYYVDLSYSTYRNNVGFSESDKVNVIPFTDFIYTPIASDITLGTVTAGLVNNRSVMLTYNGSTNLIRNIVRVDYTITLKGASNKVSGSYSLEGNASEIFTLVSGGLPRFTIDVSDVDISSNPSFRFQNGDTYIITTQYYYYENGSLIILQDQQTHNTNFTTILNL